MGGAPFNFNHMARKSNPDEGIPHEFGIPVDSFLDPNGDRLFSSTLNTALTLTQKPIIVGATGGNKITWAAADVTKAYASFTLPMNFATAYRRLGTTPLYRGVIKILLNVINQDAGGHDGAVNFSARLYGQRQTRSSGTSTNIGSYSWAHIAKATLDPGSGAGASYNWLEYDFTAVDPATSGFYPMPGDQLHLEVFPATHANNIIHLHNCMVRYNLNGAITDETLRG